MDEQIKWYVIKKRNNIRTQHKQCSETKNSETINLINLFYSKIKWQINHGFLFQHPIPNLILYTMREE